MKIGQLAGVDAPWDGDMAPDATPRHPGTNQLFHLAGQADLGLLKVHPHTPGDQMACIPSDKQGDHHWLLTLFQPVHPFIPEHPVHLNPGPRRLPHSSD